MKCYELSSFYGISYFNYQPKCYTLRLRSFLSLYTNMSYTNVAADKSTITVGIHLCHENAFFSYMNWNNTRVSIIYKYRKRIIQWVWSWDLKISRSRQWIYTVLSVYFEWDNLWIASKNVQHQYSWGILYNHNSRCISSLVVISSASATQSSSSSSAVSSFTCFKASRSLLHKTDSLLKYRAVWSATSPSSFANIFLPLPSRWALILLHTPAALAFFPVSSPSSRILFR